MGTWWIKPVLVPNASHDREMHVMGPYWGRDPSDELDQKITDWCAGIKAILALDPNVQQDIEILNLVLTVTEESVDFARLLQDRIALWKQSALLIALGDLEAINELILIRKQTRDLFTNSLQQMKVKGNA
jgi:hypothetical protein